MSKLDSILLKIADLEDLLGEGFKLELLDNLPDEFSGLYGGDLGSYSEEYIEFFSLDITNEKLKETLYVDVVMVENEDNVHKIEVKFGEYEEGTTDLDVFEVSDDKSYVEMLDVLEEYVDILSNVVRNK